MKIVKVLNIIGSSLLSRRFIALNKRQLFSTNNIFSPYLIGNKVFQKESSSFEAVNEKFFHDKELRYKVAIFDKDGTLVCFHSMWTPWAQMLNERICQASGLEISQNIWTVLGVCSKTLKTGPGVLAEGTKFQIESVLVKLLVQHGIKEAAAIEIVSQNLQDCQTNEKDLRQLHDLRHLFSVLREHNVRVAVITSDSRQGTIGALQNLNILHLVDAVVCGDDPQTEPKPSPHNAYLICQQLNVKPHEVVMIGDTKTDMQFGKNANLGGRIGVLSGIGKEKDLRENGANEIIASVEDVLPLLLPNRPIQLTEQAKQIHDTVWKLVIFDKNGTLTDIHYRWSKWAQDVGKRLESQLGKEVKSQFYDAIGLCPETTRIKKGLLSEATTLHLKESLYHLLLIRGIDVKVAEDILQQVWIEPCEYSDKVTDGVVETLHCLKSRGFKLGINTSDNRQCTERFLQTIQCSSLIDYIVTATESASFPKPLPQSTIMMCKQLNVQPEEAIMIGDSKADMLSARAARLGGSVAVLSGVSTPESVYSYADVLLPNVTYAKQLLVRGPLHPHNTSNLFKRSYSTKSKPSEEHDYVIVGAGSAGCVLANRLSEPSTDSSSSSSSSTVCLIEAGGEDNTWTIHMPAALMYNLCHDKYNWYYHTLPEPNMNNRVMYWPRGRVLGGSSSLNAMCYVRGHPWDYDRWEKEGATGWSYFACLPYFRRAQTHVLGGDAYRGDSGPLKVSRGVSNHVLHKAWLEAGVQAGYHLSSDQNGYQQEGVAPMDFTIYHGKRCSTSTAYLKPILNRPNLTAHTKLLVTRILFNGSRAIGVEVFRNNGLEKIFARKEVILSGGAINSPQLLMLSGIGDAKHLREIGIQDICQHLPAVGRNLQDHLEIYVQQQCKQPVTLYSAQWKFPHNMIRIGLQYFLTHTGWGATSHLESGGFIRSEAGVKHPDIQYHFLPSTVNDHGRKAGACHAYQVHAGPMRPLSRGRISLKSNDPREHPNIQANYMSHDRDLFEMRQGIRLAREIFAQPAFDSFRGDEISPGKEIQSDKELNAFIRAHGDTAYHPSCTCRMGSEYDVNNTVVDSNCRVLGVEGLRVVDASIMPSIVSGNLNAPTIMLAEKASDLILGKTPLSPKQVDIWTPKFPEQQRDGLPQRIYQS